MLPERSVEDIFAGRVRIVLGGELLDLEVLPIEANERWTALFQARMSEVTGGLEVDANPLSVLTFLQGLPDVQIELLRAYDAHGVLPDDAWLRSHATAPQLITALFGVLAAAFPLAATLIELARSNGDVRALLRMGWQGSTNGAPKPGAGAPAGSGVS